MEYFTVNILTFDFECTTSNKANPFDQTNRAVCLGLSTDQHSEVIYFPCSHEDFMYIQGFVDSADLLVGFNLKFDLHWLRRIGINFEGKRVWDCQLAEFLLNNQKTPYPSLDQAAEKYGLHKKLDIVKTEYWDKGIATDAVPREILSEYCLHDVALTEQVYFRQREQFQDGGAAFGKFSLFRLQCQDLLVLEEMEKNGILFSTEDARAKAKEISQQLTKIHGQLIHLVGNVPFNLNSGDNLSCILYGGTIYIDMRIPVGVYKSGEKIGQARYKIVVQDYQMPRLVEPLKGTEVKKPEGSQPIWQTNEDVLKTVKLNSKSRKIVELIKEYTKLEKLRGTYLEGWSDLIDKMHWPKDMIHGNLNQCVAVTGRLSSSKPNLQNADPITQKYCISRYV